MKKLGNLAGKISADIYRRLFTPCQRPLVLVAQDFPALSRSIVLLAFILTQVGPKSEEGKLKVPLCHNRSLEKSEFYRLVLLPNENASF